MVSELLVTLSSANNFNLSSNTHILEATLLRAFVFSIPSLKLVQFSFRVKTGKLSFYQMAIIVSEFPNSHLPSA